MAVHRRGDAHTLGVDSHERGNLIRQLKLIEILPDAGHGHHRHGGGWAFLPGRAVVVVSRGGRGASAVGFGAEGRRELGAYGGG